MSSALSEAMGTAWYPHLHAFNFLPSRLLHPSWQERFSPQNCIAGLASQLDEAALHRHWSAYILELLGLANQPCFDPAVPGLFVAILPRGAFERLVELAGAVLLGHTVRQMIRREDVAVLNSGLRPEVLAYTRQKGSARHPGIAGDASLDAHALVARVFPLGAATVLDALRVAPDAVFERVRLRLPSDTPVGNPANGNGMSDFDSLDLLQQLIGDLEPQWPSSSPLPH